jgi:hypothetical protein
VIPTSSQKAVESDRYTGRGTNLWAELQKIAGNRDGLIRVELEDYLTEQGLLIPAAKCAQEYLPNLHIQKRRRNPPPSGYVSLVLLAFERPVVHPSHCYVPLTCNSLNSLLPPLPYISKLTPEKSICWSIGSGG